MITLLILAVLSLALLALVVSFQIVTEARYRKLRNRPREDDPTMSEKSWKEFWEKIQ